MLKRSDGNSSNRPNIIAMEKSFKIIINQIVSGFPVAQTPTPKSPLKSTTFHNGMSVRIALSVTQSRPEQGSTSTLGTGSHFIRTASPPWRTTWASLGPRHVEEAASPRPASWRTQIFGLRESTCYCTCPLSRAYLVSVIPLLSVTVARNRPLLKLQMKCTKISTKLARLNFNKEFCEWYENL